MSLSIILLAKNEKNNLPIVLDDLITKIKKIDDVEIIAIKPKEDNSFDKIKNNKLNNIKLIDQISNGYGNAIKEGVSHSTKKHFIIFNSDGSFDASEISKINQKLNENNDFVFMSRYKKGGGSEDDTILTYIGNKFFTKLIQILFSSKLTDVLYTYFGGKTSAINSLKLISNDFSICVEIPIKIAIKELKYIDLPSYEKKRISGKKNVNEIIDGSKILLKIFNLYLAKIFNTF